MCVDHLRKGHKSAGIGQKVFLAFSRFYITLSVLYSTNLNLES